MRSTHTELSRESLLRILEVSHKLAKSFDLVQLLTEIVEAGKDVLLAERGSLGYITRKAGNWS